MPQPLGVFSGVTGAKQPGASSIASLPRKDKPCNRSKGSEARDNADGTGGKFRYPNAKRLTFIASRQRLPTE